MAKEAVFTLKLEPELRDAFMAEAEASHRPASQVVRELMREFVDQRREQRDYEGFLKRTVAASLASLEPQGGIPNEQVEAEFAARRAKAWAAMR
jgi:predicted transcriptional regulator